MDTLLCSVDDGVATVVLNRPSARNALSADLRRRLGETIAHLDGDAAVRAIILTGADPAFCAGVDLRELETVEGSTGDIGPRTQPLVVASTPLIGAINGATYTGGLELALACHMLIASDRATFADTHAKLRLMPGWGLTVLLSEAVGPRRARQVSTSCQPIDADTAFAWGLVNRVVPHHELLAAAMELARGIAENDHETVCRVGKLYNEQAAARNGEAWRLESRAWIGADLSGSA